MPFDERSRRVLRALGAASRPFHAAVVAAAEEVRGYVQAQSPGADGAGAEGTAVAALGAFGANRIDAGRFATLLRPTRTLESTDRVRLQWALDRIQETASGLEELMLLEVREGWSLRDAVAQRLSRIGRAFGAAQAVELLRSGRFARGRDEALLDEFPFTRWTRAERRIAPPLVVEINGGDLLAGGLAELLDGSVRVVLLVDGECPPAPLVRLITPGTLVVQTRDERELERVTASPGPAVAALVPAGAAEFVHDPAGATLPERLTVTHLPREAARRPCGRQSARQQAEELAQLAALAAVAAAPAARGAVDGGANGASAPGAAPGDATELLAGWLLRQAGLTDAS